MGNLGQKLTGWEIPIYTPPPLSSPQVMGSLLQILKVSPSTQSQPRLLHWLFLEHSYETVIREEKSSCDILHTSSVILKATVEWKSSHPSTTKPKKGKLPKLFARLLVNVKNTSQWDTPTYARAWGHFSAIICPRTLTNWRNNTPSSFWKVYTTIFMTKRKSKKSIWRKSQYVCAGRKQAVFTQLSYHVMNQHQSNSALGKSYVTCCEIRFVSSSSI